MSGPGYNANADVFEGAHADSAFDELVQLRCDAKLDAYADGVLRGMARVSLAGLDEGISSLSRPFSFI